MDAETAGAVTFKCNVNASTGKLSDTKMRIYPMTREEYQTVRERIAEKFQVSGKGLEITGGGDNRIWSDSESPIEDLGKWIYEDLQTDGLPNGRTGEIAVGMAPSAIERIGDAFNEKKREGWNIKKYDCYYYYEHNVRDGYYNFQYYIYLEKAGADSGWVLVLDTWISKDGLENIQMNWFVTDLIEEKGRNKTAGAAAYKKAVDISAFLNYDWTSDEVLWEHDIQPDDSGNGWEFYIADIDFDGKPEMLVSFTAMHCGQSALYIYKQRAGQVFSDTDTIAVMEEDIVGDIDFKVISPYMSGDLLSAYKNEANEYRYLSLDYSIHGGNIYGDWGTISLYETVLGEKSMPQEIVNISYVCPDNEVEIYFCGERIYEFGALRDKLADYMSGYTEVNIDYRLVEKSFSRGILGVEESDKKTELEELYEALREIAAN